MLLVSGGHCQFLAVEGPERFRRLGGTIDDAPGEAFDKVAKLLGLGPPGGPAVEAAATAGDARRFALPRPLLDREGCDLSFSGLKTAVRRARDRLVEAQGGITRADRADLCAGFQAAVAETLAEKTRRALAGLPRRASRRRAGAGGGRAASPPTRAIRRALAEAAAAEGAAVPRAAARALHRQRRDDRLGGGRAHGGRASPDDLALPARPRWPLDSDRRRRMLGARPQGSQGVIGVLGSGAFGTALAVAQAAEGREVRLWGRDADGDGRRPSARARSPRLPGIALPPTLRCTADLADLDGAEALLLVVPAQATEAFLAETAAPPAARAAGALRQGDRRADAPPADGDRGRDGAGTRRWRR